MADKNILHMVTPLKHMSPFDVNMALDAGYDAVLPYTQRDARGGDRPRAGRDLLAAARRSARAPRCSSAARTRALALDMLDEGQEGAGAAVRHLVLRRSGRLVHHRRRDGGLRRESCCSDKKQRDLKGLKVAVFGATGVVGFSAAVIAALEGADVTLVGYDGHQARERRRDRDQGALRRRRCTRPTAATTSKKTGDPRDARRCFAPGAPACRSCHARQLAAATKLLIVADVNAVPPAGIEGLDVNANGDELTPQAARSASARLRSATSSTRPNSACSRR